MPGTAQVTERLYEGACEAGDSSACNVYGLMLEYGQGVTRDVERAYDFYLAACEGGKLVGCTNLGLLYGTGVGVEEDLERARANYEVACEGGDPLGCDLLAAVNDAMRPDSAELYAKVGQVGDAETQVVLPNALVTLPAIEARAVSDAEGRVAFDHLPAGRYRLRAERLGYMPIEGELSVPGSQRFLVLMDPTERPGAGDSGVVVGRVTDSDGGGISDVDVRVVAQGVGTISNRAGRFSIQDVQPGLVEVRFTRLGYAPRTAQLVVQPGLTSDLQVVMPTEAIELQPISVTVRSRFLERNGFFDRREKGPFGHFLDREDIEETHLIKLHEIISRVPGVWVDDPLRKGVGTPAFAFSTRQFSWGGNGDGEFRACYLATYLDGIRLGDDVDPMDLQMIDLAMIDAIEVYKGGQTPIQYRANACGSIVIWTRR